MVDTPSGDSAGHRSSASDPNVVADAAKQLEPAQQIAVAQEIMGSFMMQGMVPNPIHQKVNEEHISQALQLAEGHDKRQHELFRDHQRYESTNRNYALIVFFTIVVFVGVLLFALQDNPSVLLPALTGIFGFGAGAMAGYGYGRSKSD